MIITAGEEQLKQLVTQQIRHNFLLDHVEEEILQMMIRSALPKVEACFSHSANKYYRNAAGTLCFSPYHSGQYTVFLYFLSRETAEHHPILADKVYYLNRMLNGVDLYHQIELPSVFMLDHPLGAVLGRAKYGKFFVFGQQCTVGGNHGIFPEIGEYVTLFAGATVIGKSKIENNVFVSAGAYIKDENIPENSIVFGRSPNLFLKQMPPSYFHQGSPFLDHRQNTSPS